MGALVPFAFEGRRVRIVEHDGATAFVAGDVAKVLGYDHTPHLTRLLDDDEKGVHIVGTPGGDQSVSVITEPGLYRALTQRRTSDKAAPELAAMLARFQRWVFHDVLPAIRSTGAYTAPGLALPAPKEVASAFRSWASIARLAGLDRNQAALAANRATLATTGVDALSLIGAQQLVAPQQARHLTVTELGQRLGSGSARLTNVLLERHGFQVGRRDPKGKGAWEPTDAGRPFPVFLDTAKRHADGTPVRQLRWSADLIAAVQAAISTAA